jgi:Nif-specific regulatory protein
MDAALSRHHCVFRDEGGGAWRVVDLDSRNGTFVNDAPAKDQRLQPGDRVRVGKSIFFFRREAGLPTAPPRGDGEASTNTIILHRSEVRYLKPEALPVTARTVQHLDILNRFGREVAAHRDREALVGCILDTAKRAALADRAVFWRVDDEPSSALSQTILNQVLEDGVAVLSNDVKEDGTLNSAESLVASRVRCAMAVPVALHERLFGVLHVDASRPDARFDQDQLELITAIGSIAAIALDNADHIAQLKQENELLKEELNVQFDMVGSAAAMQPVFQFIARVAPRDTTVLVWGESGTGKELVARAIHRNSSRADKPFVAINCAAITETLLESELFGHEKGAFTGAVAQKRGKLEAADGGTVFLDEIGELAPTLQAKLLRVLQEREFERVGGTKPLKANIRVVAATNRNLLEMSKRREFREDLYYRLNVVSVKLPALRERREDIPALAQFFVERASERIGRRIEGISAKARSYLIQYDWPGNVRELENTMERAVVLGMADTIQPEDLPDVILDGPGPPEESASSLHAAVREAKKRAVVQALSETNGVQAEAAKILGVHPVHLSRLLKTLGIKAR